MSSSLVALETSGLQGVSPSPGPEASPARRRKRSAEATQVLVASQAGILDFEVFVDSLAFLDPREAMSMKLAGGEIFDNLVRHAAPLARDSILVRCSRRSGRCLVLAFHFKSPGFCRFAATSAEGRTDPEAAPAPGPAAPEASCAGEAGTVPFFDPLIGRWRGIGLRMCRNLTASFSLRSGSVLDRIYLRF